MDTSRTRSCLLGVVVLVTLAGCTSGGGDHPSAGDAPDDGPAATGSDDAADPGPPGASQPPRDPETTTEPDAIGSAGTSVDWPDRLGPFTLLSNDDLRGRFESGAVERHGEATFFEQRAEGPSRFFAGGVDDLRGAAPDDYYAYADAAEPGPDYPDEVLTRYYALDPDGYRGGEEHPLVLRLERAEYRDGLVITGRETILRDSDLLRSDNVACYEPALICFGALQGPHFWALTVPEHTLETSNTPVDRQYVDPYHGYLEVTDEVVDAFVHLMRE